MTLGIGIVTYNRSRQFARVIESIRKFTLSPHYLVVADDGSYDDTRSYAMDRAITVIGRKNRGIAWNKNRALYALHYHTDASHYILFEDDTIAIYPRWEIQWQRAIDRHGYVTYAHPKVADAIICGEGTPLDPFGCKKITSQCSGVSRAAVDKVGFFDSRFKGYGVEDGEWSTRLRRQGFGIVETAYESALVKANCMITGGVMTIDAKSYRNNESVARNRQVFASIRDDPIPREAWRSEEEKLDLQNEVREALEICGLVLRLNTPQDGRSRS